MTNLNDDKLDKMFNTFIRIFPIVWVISAILGIVMSAAIIYILTYIIIELLQ